MTEKKPEHFMWEVTKNQMQFRLWRCLYWSKTFILLYDHLYKATTGTLYR